MKYTFKNLFFKLNEIDSSLKQTYNMERLIIKLRKSFKLVAKGASRYVFECKSDNNEEMIFKIDHYENDYGEANIDEYIVHKNLKKNRPYSYKFILPLIKHKKFKNFNINIFKKIYTVPVDCKHEENSHNINKIDHKLKTIILNSSDDYYGTDELLKNNKIFKDRGNTMRNLFLDTHIGNIGVCSNNFTYYIDVNTETGIKNKYRENKAKTFLKTYKLELKNSLKEIGH